ncbi:MAG: redoxin domain-containing protein [Halieaceae bacterium]|jgi:hypothetical protein|nr:redoxin domain-containing protein [Halieaceae bacterium]
MAASTNNVTMRLFRRPSLLSLTLALLLAAGCEGDVTGASSPSIATSNTAQTIRPDTSPSESKGKPEAGDVLPIWSLQNYQPNSPRFEQTYGLEAYKGTVTLVALFAGWCSYCLDQALALEDLWQELLAAGYEIQFVAIHPNDSDEEIYRNALIYQLDEEDNITYDTAGKPIYRSTYPLFQDTEQVDAWGLHRGAKDDFYLYGTNGTLKLWLTPTTEGGSVDTDFSHDGVREYFKKRLIQMTQEPAG